jgi:hypothetical protein
MHLSEIITNSRAEAESFLNGCEFADDTSHVAVGVRQDKDAAGQWLAIVLNYDGAPENDLDEELTDTDDDAIDLYLKKFPETEKYDRTV